MGIEPEQSRLGEIVPRPLQECVATVVSLIKVEAEFNKDRVGQTVNVAVIDRASRKPYAAVL